MSFLNVIFVAVWTVRGSIVSRLCPVVKSTIKKIQDP